MNDTPLPHSVERKIDLLFHGVRYSDALGAAGGHAFPNFHPYRFRSGEPDPTGQGKAVIPYLMRFDDGTAVRVLGDGHSPWAVAGNAEQGYWLEHREEPGRRERVDFAPRPGWLGLHTRDGLPMAAAGVSLHGDMAVVNVAPGCQYFQSDPDTGDAQRCTFCTYGAPDARMRSLGQDIDVTALPTAVYTRLAEALGAVLEGDPPRHIYLVGGSMRDWHAEGERFLTLAREVQSVLAHRVPLTCGSGALPSPALRRLHAEALVDSVCFNLEVWPRWLFQQVCPGKDRYVGYDRWIAALEEAVSLWGRGRVYSAMVAGIELEPAYGMGWEAAADSALEGAEDLCRRGIIPIYSLYWPLGGRERAGYLGDLMAYFRRLNIGYRAIRARHGLSVWDGFMCHRCAYMQLECDMDRAGDST